MLNTKKIMILILGVFFTAVIILFISLTSNPYSKVVGEYNTSILGCDFGGDEAYLIGSTFGRYADF